MLKITPAELNLAWSPPCDWRWTPLQISWQSIRAHQQRRRRWHRVSCGRPQKVSRMLNSWSRWRLRKLGSLRADSARCRPAFRNDLAHREPLEQP
jgi:hypothetical protein